MDRGIFPKQTDSTSCGPLICLYGKMILKDSILMEYNVSPVQIWHYIFKEVIKVNKNDLNTDLSFELKNIICTEDLDAVVYNIVMGTHLLKLITIIDALTGSHPKMDWDATDLVTAWKSFQQHTEFWFAGPLSKTAEAHKKSNKIYLRYKFLSRVQKDIDTFKKYLTDLKILIKDCGYATSEEMVRNAIVF
ncbi:unnamed protein product [Mytilus coruscus]|uniref:Uncharacterized protein n=1 Tax=Mytilus coruscus TaxID=42192 RepID=A0A6J8AE44_MYTCO|nr:unnamed protein product [Mytilus coruscus]